MGKSVFLKYYQENLRKYIEELVVNDWELNNLTVLCENGNIDGKFNGFIDISIVSDTNPASIIAIEIEHISDFNNAKRNIEKMKSWTHNSIYRSCGFMHIFNDGCNITEDEISELVKYAKDNEKKALGFYYDFIFYSVTNNKETRRLAEDLVSSMDFKTRLWMLMEQAGIIE